MNKILKRNQKKAEHERKRKTERKLMRQLGYSSKNYIEHKKAIKRKVLKNEIKAKARKLERKLKKKENV